MNKKDLIKALEALEMRPGKILGQNFLLDMNLLDFIVRSADPAKKEIILEAGPGLGALTRPLLDAGAEVYAIEFDRRLCEYLRNNFTMENFHLIEGDACRVDIAKVIPRDTDFRSIANLPYSISSIFIARLLELPRVPKQMIFMLQKEMAERLAGEINTKAYGALSVRVQHLYHVKILRNVPPSVFHPRPKVDLALLEFVLKDDLSEEDFALRARLSSVSKVAFSQRRKMIFKPLVNAYGEDKVKAALEQTGISPSARAATLSIAQYKELAKLL